MSTTDLKVRAKDLNISVRQSNGKGMPLLLLHGSGACKEVFRPQFESHLGDIYQLTAIDLPGHGRSDDAAQPEHTYTVGGLAAVVEAVCTELGLVRPVVFGWSLGGHIAIEMAHRSELAGLVLTGTPPIGRGPLAGLRGFTPRWDMLLVSREVFSRRDAERYMRLCFGDHGSAELLAAIERSDGRLRTQFLRSLLRGDGVDQMREVQSNPVPLAMINGGEDPVVRRSYIESLHYANLWRSTCQIVEHAGHAPFWEQPAAFNRILHAFLKDMAVAPFADSHRKLRRA
ncbi:MAG TPA: alpha/beta hydrolase [Devosia sp.]|jgi:pimeloyl-ACP methyl ester carboxylesterase|nr:alpha/beta hydrolase [Devosia sp.]